MYSRNSRISIYHPATIHDLPPEIIQKVLIYLFPRRADLISSRLVCQAWGPIAEDLLASRRSLSSIPAVCGLRLQSLVLGLESISVTSLSLEVDKIPRYIYPLAKIFSEKLTRLRLGFSRSQTLTSHYWVLQVFLSMFPMIKRLELEAFRFGSNLELSSKVKNEMSKISHLELSGCYDLEKFIGFPINDLRSLTLRTNVQHEDISWILCAICLNYPTITSLDLKGYGYISSECVIMISNCCRRIEKLTLCRTGENHKLDTPAIDALVHLPSLALLDIGQCLMTRGATAALSKLSSLRHFRSCRNDIFLPTNTLAAIGRKLWSLGTSCDRVESAEEIIRHCPNIRYLDIAMGDETEHQRICRSFTQGLDLSCFKVNNISIRLGTHWEGYTTSQRS
jgi:hypothetical protein